MIISASRRTDIKIVRPGIVATFGKTNTKRIDLEHETGWAEQTGELIYDGVMYFILPPPIRR